MYALRYADLHARIIAHIYVSHVDYILHEPWVLSISARWPARLPDNGKIINPLKTKLRLLHLKPQSVPRCKHFSSRL